jgi:hypothetical protein
MLVFRVRHISCLPADIGLVIAKIISLAVRYTVEGWIFGR